MATFNRIRILFVCSGNICRSPAAEGILLHHLSIYGLSGNVTVDSAGLQGKNFRGKPPDSRMLKAASARGYDLSKLRARGLQPADFENFDLILGMDDGHIEAMRHMCPPSLWPRIRLFLEFAPETKLREVPDPYYRQPEAFEIALDLIEAGVTGLINALTDEEAESSLLDTI